MKKQTKVWELWCPTFLNQFSRSEKILGIFLCMFVFGSLTDKPPLSPSDLKSWPLDGFHWLRWMVSHCCIIPLQNPFCYRTNPSSSLTIKNVCIVYVIFLTLQIVAWVLKLHLLFRQLAQWHAFIKKRIQRKGVLGLIISWFPFPIPPPTLLLQLNSTWYQQNIMVTSALIHHPRPAAFASRCMQTKLLS